MNNTNIKKLRTINLNKRGQIVIPEDIRKDFGIEKSATLVIMEREDELVLKKEVDVLKAMEGEDKFWKRLSQEVLEKAWGKEDEVWDKIHKNLSK